MPASRQGVSTGQGGQLAGVGVPGSLAGPRGLSLLPAVQETNVEGERYVVKTVGLPGKLPMGYHRLSAEIGRKKAETLVIVAPRKAHALREDGQGKAWGVFLPLYAFNPSPYSPASRLFWNEFYLDVARVPEFPLCSPARERMSSPGFREEVDALRDSPLVDYRRGMALKRGVIEELARSFFARNDPGRHGAFREFLAANPEGEEYAVFRATGERQRSPWPAWPKPLKERVITLEAYDEEG